MAKTKNVDGKDLTASNFAYVGDANDPATWVLPVDDEAHVHDSLTQFNQTPPPEIPVESMLRVAKRLMAAAKKFGIDVPGFVHKYGVKASRAEDVAYTAAFADAEIQFPGDPVAAARAGERAANRFLRRDASR